MTTPEEFAKQMVDLRERYRGDAEAFHAKADNLICAVLSELGYHEGVKVFEEEERWYA